MNEEEKPLIFKSEDTEHQKLVRFVEIVHSIVLKPPEWLEDLESVFKWGRSIRGMEFVRWNITGKLCDYNNQGAFYGFEKLGFLLARLFLRTLQVEENKMFDRENSSDGSEESDNAEEENNDEGVQDDKQMEQLKTMYEKCKETVDEMAANEGDIMYSRIGPALQHVLQATRASMLFYDNNHAQSQEIAKNIQPYEEMSASCKAGFEGLKAKVIMSMVQNYTVVLPYLHKAMELDPQFGYWPYLTGKVLRRARREFDEGSVEEELEYFEKAVSLERNPKFLVFLAQAYQETARATGSRGPVGDPNSFLQKAVDLYRECWSLKNDSAPISRRVGNGMMKMPPELIDKSVAKEALLKAVELSSECTIPLGKFYYFHEKDDEKALEQFMKNHPGDFGTSEIIRLNLIKDPNFDPHEMLQTWLKHVDNAVKQYRAFCDAVWYYLAYKRDLELAVNYIWRVLVVDNRSIRAKRALEYQSHAFCIKHPVNLIELLVNEILLEKERNRSLPLEEKKYMKSLENFLEKMLEKYPDLRNLNPNPHMLKNLKQEVDRKLAVMRRQRYGSGYGYNRRSEPRRQPEEPGSWRNNRSNSAQGINDQEPSRRQYVDGNRRYNQGHGVNNSENTGRNSMQNRHSFSVEDDVRRDRGYNRDYNRRTSESESSWDNRRTSDDRERTNIHDDTNRRFGYSNRGRAERQHNNYNNRYDVTVTDWRSENRRQDMS